MMSMDNRSNIINCSLKLFAERGYDAVGIQEIVDTVGITKPTLYHYFGSKNGLLQVILSQHFTDLNQRVREAADYHGNLPMTLEKITRACFQYARENPTFYRLQLALWFAPRGSEAHQAVESWHDEQYHIIETMFEQAVNNHGNMRGRQHDYAATLTGMIHTYIGLALNGYTELNDVLIRRAVHQFQHGIYS